MNKAKRADNAHKGKLDPVDFTILPIADELLTFTKVLPPDLSKWGSRYFENLYRKVDVQLVTLWLDGGGFSDAARKFEDSLNKFLVRFRKWESELRRASVISTEQLCKLQDTNERLFWGLKDEMEEICSDAEEIAEWLKKLAWLITQKRNDAKADNRDIASKQKKEEKIVLTQPQQKILKYLKKINTAVAQVDIESQTGLSNKTVSTELGVLKGYNYVAPPKGKTRRIVITQRGVDSLT